jgi:phage N-6-adenine-methyltransferase
MNKNDEWYTSPEIVELAREVLGTIDLDPASCDFANKTVKAEKFYTEENSGLDKAWNGKVWCNPPYSAKLLKHFTAKFLQEYKNGNMSEGIMLTNSGTDTMWSVPLREGVQAYTEGRVSFMLTDGSYKGKGSRGSCFTYLGDNPTKFIEVFTRKGFCWIPNEKLFAI